MQKTIMYPLLLMLLVGCGGKSYTVEVKNLSTKRFDSVHVFINTDTHAAPTVKFGSLPPGEALPPMGVGEVFGMQHSPITGAAIFYAADTVVRYQFADKKDTAANSYYTISIDSNLSIKWSGLQ